MKFGVKMKKEKIKIVAIVKDKDGYSNYILNRMPSFEVYDEITTEKLKSIVYSRDCGFINALIYQMDNTVKAFCGSEFDINLSNGEVIKSKGNWWHDDLGCFDDHVGITTVQPVISTIENLKKCYVWCSGPKIEKSFLQELIAEYNGDVHDFDEHEKSLAKTKVSQ